MLHPHLNPKNTDYWHKLESQEAWDNNPQKTIKLDVLAKTVMYHLQEDGHQPLTMDPTGQLAIPNPDRTSNADAYPECDRVVIFSAFPSSNAAIVDVSLSSGA